MLAPTPIGRFVLMKAISSLSFILTAVIVFIIKSKLEEKRYDEYRKKMVSSVGRRP